jgi:hypothetical protein
MRVLFASLAALAAVATSSVALAQGAPPAEVEDAPPAGEKPEDVTIVVPSGSTTTVVTTGGGAPATTPPAEPLPKKFDEDEPKKDGEEEGEDEARFRGGISGNLGVFIPGPMFQLGPQGRLGAQIDDMWAVYVDLGAHGGFGWGATATAEGADVSISAGGAVSASLMGEITVEDIFFVALGPTLLYGAFATFDSFVGTDAAGTSVSAFAGPLPGIKIRTGGGFGKNRPARRKQFTLALEANVLFGQKFDVTSSGTVDESVSTGIAVGFLPMLSLGYDAK